MKSTNIKGKLNKWVSQNVVLTLASGNTVITQLSYPLEYSTNTVVLNQLSGLTQSEIQLEDIVEVNLLEH